MEKLAGQVATHVSAHFQLTLELQKTPCPLRTSVSPSVRVRKSSCVGPLQVLESHHSAGVSGVRGKLDGLVAAGANTSDL